MSEIDSDLLALRQTFYEEAEERLVDVEGLLLELERRPQELELLDAIFRAVHSIKGGSGACDLSEVTAFAHTFENLLASLRTGQLVVNPGLLNVLLQSTDTLSALLQAAKNGAAQDEDERVAHSSYLIRVELSAVEASPESLASGECVEDLSAGMVLWDSDDADASVDVESTTAVAEVAHDFEAIGVVDELVDALIFEAPSAVNGLDAQEAVGVESRLPGAVLQSRSELALPIRASTQPAAHMGDESSSMLLFEAIEAEKNTASMIGRASVDTAGRAVEPFVDTELNAMRPVSMRVVQAEPEIGRKAPERIAVLADYERLSIRVDAMQSESMSLATRADRPATSCEEHAPAVFDAVSAERTIQDSSRLGSSAVAVDSAHEKQSVSCEEVSTAWLGEESSVELADMALTDLVQRAGEIAAGSAQLSHAVSDPDTFEEASLSASLQRLSEQVTELEARLTTLRGGGFSSRLIDGVVVRCAHENYVINTGTLDSYLRPEHGALRTVPMHGQVLMTEYGILPVVWLAALVGMDSDGVLSDTTVALIGRVKKQRVALLAEEVLTQGKLLVKPLETNFQRVRGIDGAVPFGAKLALVLDLEALLDACKFDELTQSRCDRTGSVSLRRSEFAGQSHSVGLAR